MKYLQSDEQKISFEEMLDQYGYIVYTIVGYSMMPLLRQRKDIVEIKKKDPGRCKKYDVVLYKRGDNYVLHRILKVLSTGYIIAGDNNGFIESGITDDQILGVMTRIIRDGKSISVKDLTYQVYVHLWCDLYPARMAVIKVREKIAISKNHDKFYNK